MKYYNYKRCVTTHQGIMICKINPAKIIYFLLHLLCSTVVVYLHLKT